MIYWDTSCLLKFYVREPDSQEWVREAFATEDPWISSELSRAELLFSLRAKESRKEIKPGAAVLLASRFSEDMTSGLFSLTPLGEEVFRACERLCAEKSTPRLRTLDGIHLATALVCGCRRIATTDSRLAEAAEHHGVEVIHPSQSMG